MLFASALLAAVGTCDALVRAQRKARLREQAKEVQSWETEGGSPASTLAATPHAPDRPEVGAS
jgi:hypothetical protein